MYHRRPHPDLPAIPEDTDEEAAGTPGSITSPGVLDDIDLVSPSASVNDAANNSSNVDLDDILDDSSLSVNSCTFSLDNVGFDEENSLLGSSSIVDDMMQFKSTGSLNHDGTSSLNNSIEEVYTPSSSNSPQTEERGTAQQNSDRKGSSRRKKGNLTPRTCRTLGLPFSPDTDNSSSACSPSSGSDATTGVTLNSSFLGSISVSSCSADEIDTARITGSKEVEKHTSWSWSSNKSISSLEGGNRMSTYTDEIVVPLDTMMTTNNTHMDSIYSSKDISQSKQSSLAKLSKATSRFKGAISSFSERIDEAYQKSKEHHNQQQNTVVKSGSSIGRMDRTGDEAYIHGTSSSTLQLSSGQLISNNEVTQYSSDNPHHNKASSTIQDLLPPSWVSTYKQTNPLIKLAAMGGLLFLLLLTIMIVTIVCLQQEGTKSSGKGRGDQIDLIDLLNSLPNVEEEEALEGSNASPNSTPSNPTSDNTFGTEICIDKEGKYRNAKGKARTCHWLMIHTPGELYTDRLDVECGAVGMLEPSELALACQHTCRGYNGCPLSTEDLKKEEEENAWEDWLTGLTNNEEEEEDIVGEGEEDQSDVREDSVSMKSSQEKDVHSIPSRSDAPTTHPTQHIPPVSTATVPQQHQEETATMEVFNNITLPTFINTRGRERPCSWLDIRNENLQLIRRDANCVLFDVQEICPSSCIDYYQGDVATGIVDVTNQAIDDQPIYSMTEEGVINVPISNGQVVDSSMILGFQDSSLLDENTDESSIHTLYTIDRQAIFEMMNSYHENQETSPQLQLRTSTIEATTCSDKAGYYLNHLGQVEQCSWLINTVDPLDETRRTYNCGFPNIPSTDLGKMCKSTCGMCYNGIPNA